MRRLLPMLLIGGLLFVGGYGCTGSSDLGDTEAAVYLTVDVDEYQPDVNMACSWDVTISKMSITSHPKDPNATLTSAQDVRISRWVITPYRTDGGTTASPQWIVDQHVTVPAGESADLENYRVFPREYFYELPLSYLLPENGGFDPETGNQNIRQALKIELFGKTMGGEDVSVVFNVQFNFFYDPSLCSK